MNMFKHLLLASLFVFLISSTLCGQTFDAFKKQANQDFDTYKNQVDEDYSDFKQKTIQSFNDYVKQVDKEFADYLKSNFGEHALKQLDKEVETPKPDQAPVYVDALDIKTEKIESSETDQQPIDNDFALPSTRKSEPANFETNNYSFNFYSSNIEVSSDIQINIQSRSMLSADKISAYWTELSNTNYNHLIDQFGSYRQVLNLNDWAYYLMINSFANEVYPDQKDMKTMLSWFLLTRSGYKTRIAFDENQNYLLLSSVYPITGSYVRFDNVNYYLSDGEVDHLQTYEKDVPEADKILDLSIEKPLNLANKKADKSLEFKYHGQTHKLKLSYNKNLIDFYSSIPLSDIKLYFNSLPGISTKLSIAEAFRPIINRKTKLEAANILLSFVQQAFGYKTDQEAYGKEKYMFTEELLHYPFADCEDRSVLYAYLVKTLLNLEVIGVEFPGHMATGIHFKDKPSGEFIEFGKKDYVIADPTFVGAPVGMLMSGVNKSDAKVIAIKSGVLDQEKSKKIWDIVRKYGGYRSDVLQDVVFAPSGNAYVCGYFVKEANFGRHQLVSEYEGRDMFIAKFDPDMNPVWAKKASGPGNDMAYSIALDPRGILYVYGSLESTLSFNSEVSIEAIGQADVFVARYAPNGDVRWVTKAGIDKVDHSANFMFAAAFDPSGKKVGAKLFNETKDFDYYGLHLDGNGNAVINGSFYATTGLNTTSIQLYNNVHDIPKVLKDTNDYLHDNLSYERTIAGLFSAIRLIRFDNFELSGVTIQNTIETYNKPFTTRYKKLYDKIGKLSFVINNTGIVVIKTENKHDVDFKYIRIHDNARIKIITYDNGNSKIDVLSGIKIVDESSEASFDMNSISLSKEKGDLLFDFDDDHSKFKLNLKTEILE